MTSEDDRHWLQPYLDLMTAAVEERLDAGEFCRTYWRLFQLETHRFEQSTYERLNWLHSCIGIFGDTDPYISNPVLTDDALRDEAAAVLRDLRT